MIFVRLSCAVRSFAHGSSIATYGPNLFKDSRYWCIKGLTILTLSLVFQGVNNVDCVQASFRRQKYAKDRLCAAYLPVRNARETCGECSDFDKRFTLVSFYDNWIRNDLPGLLGWDRYFLRGNLTFSTASMQTLVSATGRRAENVHRRPIFRLWIPPKICFERKTVFITTDSSVV